MQRDDGTMSGVRSRRCWCRVEMPVATGALLLGEPLAHALDGAGEVADSPRPSSARAAAKAAGGAGERMADRREAPHHDRRGKAARTPTRSSHHPAIRKPNA